MVEFERLLFRGGMGREEVGRDGCWGRSFGCCAKTRPAEAAAAAVPVPTRLGTACILTPGVDEKAGGRNGPFRRSSWQGGGRSGGRWSFASS